MMTEQEDVNLHIRKTTDQDDVNLQIWEWRQTRTTLIYKYYIDDIPGRR